MARAQLLDTAFYKSSFYAEPHGGRRGSESWRTWGAHWHFINSFLRYLYSEAHSGRGGGRGGEGHGMCKRLLPHFGGPDIRVRLCLSVCQSPTAVAAAAEVEEDMARAQSLENTLADGGMLATR